MNDKLMAYLHDKLALISTVHGIVALLIIWTGVQLMEYHDCPMTPIAVLFILQQAWTFVDVCLMSSEKIKWYRFL